MSKTLLQRVRGHIVTDGGLLTGYTTRYYRWTDTDLKGSGNVALFRMSGTGGPTDFQQQQHDVSLYLMGTKTRVTQADTDMLSVLQYLRANFDSANVFSYTPLQAYTGPTYLSNGRAIFEMVIRCGVTDH